MIDESRTLEIYGYQSDELSYGSDKRVVSICDNCGRCRDVVFGHYSDLCNPCSRKGQRRSEEAKQRMSDAMTGKQPSVETRQRMSDARKGQHCSEKTKQKISDAHKGKILSKEHRKKLSDSHKGNFHTEETRKKMSASQQGIQYEAWESYAKESPYCPRFNDACRESNREKYGRKCFMGGLPESENVDKNGKQWKLSVHHVDMNKSQGCDGIRWKLVPLCMKHHGHSDLWMARIVYLLAIS